MRIAVNVAILIESIYNYFFSQTDDPLNSEITT